MSDPNASSAPQEASMNQHSIFGVLTLELPDPQQELYVQPSTFTLFPHLIPKLRLQIWRETFPSTRHIDLHEVALYSLSRSHCRPRITSYRSRGKVRHGETKNFKRYWPIALSVNKESREETLRHYAIVPLQHLAPTEFHLRGAPPFTSWPLCVRLELDTASWYPSRGAAFRKLEDAWFNHINTCASHLPPKLQKLEMQIFDFEDFTGLETDCFDKFCEASLFLTRFPSLKTLILSILPREYADEKCKRAVLQGAGDQAQVWLEGGVEANSDTSSLPRIIVRQITNYDWGEPICFANEEEAWDAGTHGVVSGGNGT